MRKWLSSSNVRENPNQGSPALSMIGARIISITWLDSANLCRMHGGLFLFPLEYFGGLAQSRLDHSLEAGSLTLLLETTASTAACPICGAESNRVHSRYHRALADLPCFGKAVRLAILVRRFFCTDAQCPRRIFAERLLGFARPYSRTTDRLRHAHEAVGSALGGEPGSRLTARLAISSSPDTLLRRVKQFEGGSPSPPRFVGIDDWAWRKGQRYGTIVVDLERSDIIDLLPDRDATTVKKWLNDHPGVELISRDRSSAYAQAAADSAPNALQVADRWHLLKNLREAIERLFERRSDEVNEAVKAPAAATESPCNTPLPDAAHAVTAGEPSSPPQPIAEPTSESPQLQAQRARRRKRIDRFKQVHERHRRRHSARRIARELGMSFHTVQRYLRCKECPDWKPGRAWRSRWDAHREWIDARIAEGCTNAAELHRQLVTRDFRGSYNSVQRYVRKRLGVAGRKRERADAARPSAPPPPSPRQLSFEWVRRPEDRKPNEQRRIEAIRASSHELATALGLADEFADLIRKRSSKTLSDWLVNGEASSCQEIRRFAEGIRRDESAVLAAVTQQWSNGPVEGHINRLKTVKRQMYGRAGFVLLRARILCAA
jgi:transposase